MKSNNLNNTKDPSSYNFLFKIIIIGDTHVGKSNILLRFADDVFQESFQPTIGVDFKIKSLVFEDIPIKLQLWDTAGQERFRNITNSYYKGAHGIILVYDITNHMSFQNLDIWLEEVEKHGASNLTKILIGNKCDLQDMRQVDKQEAMNKAEDSGMPLLETSAKDGINVEKVFLYLIKEIKEKIEKGVLENSHKSSKITNEVKPGLRLDTKNKEQKKNCGC